MKESLRDLGEKMSQEETTSDEQGCVTFYNERSRI